MTEAFICDYIRTPIGRYGGALSSVRADDLGAVPLKALMAKNASVDWDAVDDRLDAWAERGRLRAALSGLSESDRELLPLVAWEGLTPAEAAAVLGIGQAAARSRLHRTRMRVIRALHGHPDGPDVVTTSHAKREAS